MLGGQLFGFGIDLAADQDSSARQVKPEHEDNDGAERAVRAVVRIEVLQIGPQAVRDEPSERAADARTRREQPPHPRPELRREIAHMPVGDDQQEDDQRDLQHFPSHGEDRAET